MSTRGGLYWRLRDTSTSWGDKVKLARYAWKHDNIAIPNKEQTLLDWMVQSLSGKRRLSSGQSAPVWRCLQDVLHTHKCHTLSKYGQPLLLKPAIFQVLLDELQSQYKDVKCSNRSHCDVIISCCLSIVTSQNIGYSFTSKYELMQQLVVFMSGLCAAELLRSRDIPDTWCHLLRVAITKYDACQKLKANAQQLVQQTGTKVLPSAINLMYQITSLGDASERFRDIDDALKAVLSYALFSKDLLEWYEVYLQIKVEAKQTKSMPPKFIDSVFSQITAQLQANKDTRPTLHFIQWFFHQFVKIYRPVEKPVGFHMLKYMCKLVGVDPCAECVDEECVALEPVTSLLQLTAQLDMYQLAADQSTGGKQLAWLQQLASWLLKMESRSRWWFGSLEQLLRLSHSVLESSLPTLLSAAWIDSEPNEAHEVDQVELLGNIVSVYSQLRQVDKFIDKLMLTIKQKNSHSVLVWPGEFKSKLGSVLTNLPQGMCVTIWKALLAETQSVMVHIEDTKEKDAGNKLEAFMELFSIFLLHIKVADYTITQQTSTAISALMVQTTELVIKPLLTKCQSKMPIWSRSVLYLTWSWGELYLTLNNFTNYSPQSQENGMPRHGSEPFQDLSVIHPCLSATEWRDLIQGADLDNKALCYTFELLYVQKVRALLLLHGDDMRMRDSIRSIVTWLYERTPSHNLQQLERAWHPQSVVNEDTYVVAHWHLICDNMWLLAHHCDSEQLLALCSYLLWTTNSHPKPSTSGSYSLHGLSEDTLCGRDLPELTVLQSSFITSLAYNMSQQITPKKGKSPKKPKTQKSTLFGILEKLADYKPFHSSEKEVQKVIQEGSTEWEALRQIAQEVENLTDGADTLVKPEHLSSILSFLKVLEKLPVEYLHCATQLCCFMLVFSVVSIRPTQTCDQWEELCRSSYNILELLLDIPPGGTTQLFSLLHSGKLLTTLLSRQKEHSQEVREVVERVMVQLVRISTKNSEVLVDLQPFVWRIVEDLEHLTSSVESDQSHAAINLQAAVNTLQVFAKILSRENVKDSIIEPVRTYFIKLSSTFENVVKFYLGRGVSHLNGNDHLVALILLGYGTRLELQCKTEDNLVVKKLKPICHLCLDILKREQKQNTLKKVLYFVKAVCRNHVKLKESLAPDFMKDIWQHLLKLVEQSETRSDVESVQRKSSITPSSEGETSSHFDSVGEEEEMEIDIQTKSDQLTNENSEKEFLRKEVEQTMATVISTYSTEEFKQVVDQLIQNIGVAGIGRFDEMIVNLEVWQRLLTMDVQQEQYTILQYAAQDLFLRLQQLCSEVSSQPLRSGHTELLATILQTQAKTLAAGQGFLSQQIIPFCLNACVHTPLDGTTVQEFCRLYGCAYEVVNAMLVHHHQVVLGMIPSYVAAVRHLLVSLIRVGNQDITRSEGQITQMVACAHLMDRLCSLLVTYKVDFNKVAVYLVADYVNEVQKLTLLPQLKRAVLPGIYRLLEMCDQHSIALLFTVLPSGVKEIFGILYSDYKKYYKYTGKV